MHALTWGGEALAFAPMPGKLYFFDTATGKRLRA